MLFAGWTGIADWAHNMRMSYITVLRVMYVLRNISEYREIDDVDVTMHSTENNKSN